MANVNDISSNSYDSSSSIYGSRNVISGLASGMDTEALIKNSVSGYQAKITELQQKQDKLNWKVDAMRGIIDDTIALSGKYISYTSKTNLYSESFYTRTITTANGVNADKVSATGRTGSQVTIDSVTQLASQARYSVNVSALKLNGNSMTGSGAIDWDELKSTGSFSKTKISFNFDGVYKSFEIGELGVSSDMSDEDASAALKNGLQQKLNEVYGSGKITVDTTGGRLGFSVTSAGSHTLQVTGGAQALKLENGLSNYLDTDRTLGALLGESYFDSGEQTLVINGVEIGTFDKDATMSNVLKAINSSDAGVSVTFSSLTGEIAFTSREVGSAGRVEFGGGLAERLFRPESGPSGMTVGELLGDKLPWSEDGTLNLNFASAANGKYNLGSVSKSTTVQELIDKIGTVEGGRFSDMIQFDRVTGTYSIHGLDSAHSELDETAAARFSLEVAGSGANRESVSFTDVFLQADTGYRYTAGQDALVTATVNGKTMELSRSGNTFEIDGLSVTVKELFTASTEEEKVSFTSTTDTKETIETITAFVNDYNALLEKIHKGFATMPAEKSTSSHTKYEPLTESDKKDMSDTAIAAYEEKAKQGILYQDPDLSMMYSRLVTAVTTGVNARDLQSIGITSAFDITTQTTKLEIDEEKLKKALEDDPDMVSDLFARSTSGGASSDGLMATIKTSVDLYVNTSSASQGVLVKKAGTKLSSVSLLQNDWQTQLDKIQEKIESWQTKMSARVDFYTKQYTALEKLINNMNNQSSMLSGLQGGY